MINYLLHFFNPVYLFNLRPAIIQQTNLIVLIAFFGLLIVLAGFSRLLVIKTKDGLKIKAYRRFSHLFLTIGILGLIYLFFAWQGVAILSARFWPLVLAIVALVWLVFIAKYLLMEIPKLRREIENKRKFEKYLP
jgi:cytochrome c oxidase subunit IV